MRSSVWFGCFHFLDRPDGRRVVGHGREEKFGRKRAGKVAAGHGNGSGP
jgi:hypothetical protein